MLIGRTEQIVALFVVDLEIGGAHEELAVGAGARLQVLVQRVHLRAFGLRTAVSGSDGSDVGPAPAGSPLFLQKAGVRVRGGRPRALRAVATRSRGLWARIQRSS